jgi:phosphoribosylaminoimidazole-succinocarboxamide synthase
MGSRFPRASWNPKSSPPRSSRPPRRQNKERTTRTSLQNEVPSPYPPQILKPSLFRRNSLPKFPAAAALIGKELYDRISTVAVELYSAAAEYAATRGLIIADTKFEFGLVDGELILIDEALTPDSSRYWPQEGYAPGRGQPSFDKQYLRDWLTSQGFRKGLEAGTNGQGWTMSEEVVQGTRERYLSAKNKLLQ